MLLKSLKKMIVTNAKGVKLCLQSILKPKKRYVKKTEMVYESFLILVRINKAIEQKSIPSTVCQ